MPVNIIATPKLVGKQRVMIPTRTIRNYKYYSFLVVGCTRIY